MMFVEKNIHGAWVIYGDIGIRQYYYTKKQAMEMYKEEVAKMTEAINNNNTLLQRLLDKFDSEG